MRAALIVSSHATRAEYLHCQCSVALKLQSASHASLSFRSTRPYSESNASFERTNGDSFMKHSLKTAALAFGVAALFGSAAVGFADSTDSTSSTSETTTTAPAPVAVYPVPVVVAPPPPIVVAAPAPVVVAEPAEPSTTTSEHRSSSST